MNRLREEETSRLLNIERVQRLRRAVLNRLTRIDIACIAFGWTDRARFTREARGSAIAGDRSRVCASTRLESLLRSLDPCTSSSHVKTLQKSVKARAFKRASRDTRTTASRNPRFRKCGWKDAGERSEPSAKIDTKIWDLETFRKASFECLWIPFEYFIEYF